MTLYNAPAPSSPYNAPTIVAPRFTRHASFTGAAMPVCGCDVLVVVVQPWILNDAHEASLYVVAFQMRFQRLIVLMAQDDAQVPTYYGPPVIVNALAALPFDIIPWQRMLYRIPKPRTWQLPIPPEPPPQQSTARGSASLEASLDASLEATNIFDAEVAERMARSTAR